METYNDFVELLAEAFALSGGFWAGISNAEMSNKLKFCSINFVEKISFSISGEFQIWIFLFWNSVFYTFFWQ